MKSPDWKSHCCPSCEQHGEVPDHYEGKSVRCLHCGHSFIPSKETQMPVAKVQDPSEDTKTTVNAPESKPNSSNAGLFTLIASLFAFLVFGLAEFVVKNYENTPTGYETTTKFVEDGDFTDRREFEEMMAEGWEVMHQRRAWTARYSYTDDHKDWGTEYTMRKPTYD